MHPASAGSPGILPAGSPGKFKPDLPNAPKQESTKNKKNKNTFEQPKNVPTSKSGYWQVSGFADASTRLSSNDLKFQEEASI